MNIYINNILRCKHWKRLLLMVAMFHVPCSMFNVYAQISIGGNVYGGGNAGNTGGSTSVTVRMGDIDGSVFGGARMANVGGSAFVNIDGEHAPDDAFILINKVYGGNDIAGTVGSSTNLPKNADNSDVLTLAAENRINNTWNAFVRVSSVKKETTGEAPNQTTTLTHHKVYIGQLFGGGNGDYTYTGDLANLSAPELGNTYLEIVGGSIVYAYGGGNNATVNAGAVICVDNPSEVVNSIKVKDGKLDDTSTDDLLTDERLQRMGVNTTFSHPRSGSYQIGNFFGGNNKATMAIRPKWNLKDGLIRNLYSGGNEGKMTSPDGILLEINENSNITVDYVYGGCRKADVMPLGADGQLVSSIGRLQDRDENGNLKYNFPENHAARTLIKGGHIHNVYGGNDISGKVYFGNAVGIWTSIIGDVYGGGNGSYPYTDNDKLTETNKFFYGDFYYEVPAGKTSVEALNDFRPNAEQVSIRVQGKDEQHPTIIGGALYIGGNSATLKPKDSSSKAELKIGSYVIADQVFLGNNGENMTAYNAAEIDQTTQDITKNEGVLRTFKRRDLTSDGSTFSSLVLKDEGSVFDQYMDGCAMENAPSVIFDNEDAGSDYTYEEHSTYFGSFYCGGNVGSLIRKGKVTINFDHAVVIYDKLVGGCNNAYVEATEYNDEYVGGVIGDPQINNDGNQDKLELNLSGLKIEPKRWKTETVDGKEVRYINPTTNLPELEWNTYIGDRKCNQVKEEDYTTTAQGYYQASEEDMKRRLVGGNIYGGCCESGVVNGNVIININSTIVEREKLFDEVKTNADDGEESLYKNNIVGYNDDRYHITKRHTGVILGQQGMDVLGNSLNVFGGGKGTDTEIWGSTTINLNKGYVFQVFGGSEQGVIGMSLEDNNAPVAVDNPSTTDVNEQNFDYEFNGKHYNYNAAYSCHVNLKGSLSGVSKREAYNEDMPECEFIYGGGFMGPIAGNTIVQLGNGRIFNSFAGSCAADILGHTETYIGYSHDVKDETSTVTRQVEGFPWIRDYVYGGNDLGGTVMGTKDFSDRIRHEVEGLTLPGQNAAKEVSAYVEYKQGRALGIFGGCFGTYDYANEYPEYANVRPYMDNAFVNFRPTNTSDLKGNVNNVVSEIYGAGEGYLGDPNADKMQERCYVLIDIPQDMENYKNMKVFGAGAWCGLGMKTLVDPNAKPAPMPAKLDAVSAIIDLARGQIATVYGGSYREGVTRRTVINVPEHSTITLGSIFGGAYGTDTYHPCDVYEANVNYHSSDAVLIYDPATNPRYLGAIFGGNNNERRTVYGRVYIDSEVKQRKVIQYDGEIEGWLQGQELPTNATVYGAGLGTNTWSEYTLVDLQPGAKIYEVYGGGQAGKVFNTESIQNFINNNKPTTWPEGTEKAGDPFTDDDWKYAWKLGGKYDKWDGVSAYWQNPLANLSNALVRQAEMDDRDFSQLDDEDKPLAQNRYNANVIIHEGAYVGNYAYGGGLGVDAVVSGSTYIALLGGEVKKDIYAAGTSGSVEDLHGAGLYNKVNNRGGFSASANVYIKGGTVRNVYGGGWRGSVGHHGPHNQHTGVIYDVENNQYDIDGESHVVIGDIDGTSHTNGIPSITRNVYGGGEGGTVFGHAYVTINKGYIGYRYNSAVQDDATTAFDERYVAELDDKVAGDKLLDNGGNVFGGGYVANSYVDHSHVTMWNGVVRGSLYGGGEIGPIGRGTVLESAPAREGTIRNAAAKIYKGGSTEVYMWGGHVMRDVFGGGRGYDNWGGDGYMTDEEKETMDRSSKGYVFGSTDVHIRGGEIGTIENVLRGFGNVFGGGNEGFVYSATGTKRGSKQNSDLLTNGIPTDGGGFYYVGNGNTLSVDCNVDIEPYCQVTAAGGITIDKAYAQGEYVPVEVLNTLKSRRDETALAQWNKLDTRGVIIHNALFAGGNITEGSDKLFANTVTVYGNAGASLRDVYNYDLISLGTEDMGGLYGDGNLTLVDGFREIHIDNYGTDYYSLPTTMELRDYNNLTERQQAYYKLKYVANATHTYEYYESKMLHPYTPTGGQTVNYRRGQKVTAETYNTFTSTEQANWSHGTKTFQKDDQIEEGEWMLMDSQEQNEWTLWGVTSIYAGRPMNTIQRADMCGVFGSRLVLKGAVDRAPQVNGGVDYNSYTINRVDEVSLNKRETQAGDNSDIDKEHGNYFGIYSSVKFLGNLTSDVAFADVRQTDTNNDAIKADGTTSYYIWKHNKPQNKYRNNGISHNKVALASGVYLEIKREEGETSGKDDWGYITGVIELDLINVMPGMGGGYVYAKNEHGDKTYHDDYGKVTLLPFNNDARTYRHFTYTDKNNTASLQPIETSGNFVHNTKQIVDDCYPNSGIYNDGYDESPAHYWFIRGSIYVYDQYISAYTGSANATAEKQEIPLTITAASHGKMTLRDVQPNFYAYYDKNGNKMGDLATNADTVFVANNITYKLNQPISYWEYSLLSEGDKAKFVNKTFVVIADCKIGETEYKKGMVLLENEYNALKNSTVKYMEDGVEKTDGKFNYFFRSSNNLSHHTGYVLTYDVNNPMVWNNYYTKTSSPGQANALNTEQYFEKNTDGSYKVDQSLYTEGPTYTLKSNATESVYGQQDYLLGNILYGSTVTAYETNVKSHITDTESQAQVEKAYVVTKQYSVTNETGDVIQDLKPGTPIYKSKYTEAQWSAIETAQAAELAKVCTSLLEFTTTDYVWAGKVLSSKDIDELKTKVIEKNKYVDDSGEGGKTAKQKAEAFLESYLDDAWYCTSPGKYGGIYFERGRAYRALDTWCSMSAAERANFDFNYDAFDLLIDSDYSGEYGSKGQYDGPNTNKVYSGPQPIDYRAEYTLTESTTYTDKDNVEHTLSKPANSDGWLSRTAYENIPNEKHFYSPITVTSPNDSYYMVNTPFMNGEVPYTTGQQIDQDTYQSLLERDRTKVDVFKFTSAQTNAPNADGSYNPKTYYYCHTSYTIGEKGEGVAVTTTAVTMNNTTVNSNSISVGSPVDKGSVIAEGVYDDLKNFQSGFVIHGTSPTEVSTLYVSNESDIHDLSTEKIITVIYLYEYEESDESGLNVTPVSERHILNIHINFKSGVPEIGEIKKPDIVLPGTTIGMNIPSVTQGAYRVTESGWEIFSNADDAATHYNGEPFYNNETPLYWYQNGYWIAYYAQTSLGKTYSKSVKLDVANYHDLKKVMDDKDHHYYIDHIDVDRRPKIYINDYSTTDPATTQNGLDLLKNLFDLSYQNTTWNGHQPLNARLKGGNGLEFFLRTDLDHSSPEWTEWTPIANNDGECFSGTLHGDGHTISGLGNSFINHLCGHIYNLGVSGSFTSGGIADTGDGYMENCWVKTTGTPAADTHPLFGNPSKPEWSQVVNSYYLEDGDAAKYTAFTDGKNMATKKPSRSFYNGEVAYNLNGFYLNKRYYVGTNTAEPEDPADSKLTSGSEYVINRFKDGDFIYANGTIPGSLDERATVDNEGKPVTDANGNIIYTPKWPGDYIFFGQALNYGHIEGRTHQEVPSSITGTNRVFRAPAYFGNGTMSMAHFNQNAVFAKSKKDDETVEAYKGMTAIDFTGNNDSGYKRGLNSGLFYQPLLDDDGLTGFTNADLTSNLLVYTGTAEPASSATNTTVRDRLADKTYQESNETTYRNVAAVTDGVSSVRGHWVQLTDARYVASRDHFLVDKQDFNAPIRYDFDDEHRMWYQRLPENFAGQYTDANGDMVYDASAGWEGISLPFKAEIVTTNTKGELTHFYGDSSTGHEYWLREYKGGSKKEGDDNVFVATMNRPAANSDGDKEFKNTFLWDYYYSKNNREDLHGDQYPDATYKYYSEEHTYEGYPRQAKSIPYIIGFPGERYYEFDLSGKFEAKTAMATTPAKLGAQVVTFASNPGVAIDVSDTELATAADQTKANGYAFVPNYTAKAVSDGFMLNATGSSYDKTASAITVPFRPYFIAVSGGAPKMTRSIIFSDEQTQLEGRDDDASKDKIGESVDIYGGKHKVIVTSNLRRTADVRIFNVGGLCIANFNIEPGETIEHPIYHDGVYVVHVAGGRYRTKLAVK